MRTASFVIVGIALLGAACATGGQRPSAGTNASNQPQGGGEPSVIMPNGPRVNGAVADGIMPNGPGVNAAASRPEGRSTGVKVDTVRVVGGQLVTSR